MNFTARLPVQRAAFGDGGQSQEHFEALGAHHRRLADMGGTLPGEFRKPRRAGGGGDCPNRGPDARCRAPVRTGHPLGPRERLCPKRGARPRGRGAVLRRARLRDIRRTPISRRPATCYLRWGADGKVRQLDLLYPQLAGRVTRGGKSGDSADQQFDVAALSRRRRRCPARFCCPADRAANDYRAPERGRRSGPFDTADGG